MKNKFGFTLAEVLITLGIIGVVAALTAPALVKNSGQSKIGPSLAKFVNTFETACEQLMYDEGASTLRNAIGNKDLLEALSKYIIMSPSSDPLFVNWPDGSLYSTWPNGLSGYIMKDGSFVYTNAHNDAWANVTFPKPFKGVMGEVVVDINGLKGSNIIGKEVFVFYIDASGILIPYGGNMHKSLQTVFTATCNPQSKSAADVWACTGAIADNGWKADY